MIEKTAVPGQMITLGHTGENGALRVAFSLLPYRQTLPGGKAALLVQRHGDAEAYPVSLETEGDTAYWTVCGADTEKAGYGQCELQWYLGETLTKSDKFDFWVSQALEAGTEPPEEPSKRWFDALRAEVGDLDALTTETKESLVAAINELAGAPGAQMRVSGGYIQYSSDGGASWENVIATSALKGDAGYSPTITVQSMTGGVYISIRNQSAQYGTFIKNGADGKTPEIGANGNWYLGETDTGKPSRGEKGETGAVDITALSQSEYTAASAAGTLDEGKWYGVYPDA